MCSIFGYIARKNTAIELPTLRAIIGQNIGRGPHAFGFAWIDSRDRLHAFKSAGRLTDNLNILAILRDARMMIGHLRYATHGAASDNSNNHPHPVDGGWLVHNGVVMNYENLLDERPIYPTSECDSEAVAQLIERSDQPTLAGRGTEAIAATTGHLAIAALWPRPGKLLVARRGNPLHVGKCASGSYFASLASGLPGEVRSLVDNRAFEFDAAGICRGHKTIPGEKLRSREYALGGYRGG